MSHMFVVGSSLARKAISTSYRKSQQWSHCFSLASRPAFLAKFFASQCCFATTRAEQILLLSLKCHFLESWNFINKQTKIVPGLLKKKKEKSLEAGIKVL